MKITIKHMAWVGGLAILFGLYSVYASQGTVIDGSTGEPMAGVHVVAAWNASVAMPVQATTRCYHAEATVTDERGRFSLSTFSGNWNPLLWGRSRSVWAFAPGYVTSDKSDYENLDLVLLPASGTNADRFKSLPHPNVLGCGAEERIFLPLWRALFQQASQLAGSGVEKKAADLYLYRIEVVELGEGEALRRQDERARTGFGGERK